LREKMKRGKEKGGKWKKGEEKGKIGNRKMEK
jgi:hypothetical protein